MKRSISKRLRRYPGMPRSRKAREGFVRTLAEAADTAGVDPFMAAYRISAWLPILKIGPSDVSVDVARALAGFPDLDLETAPFGVPLHDAIERFWGVLRSRGRWPITSTIRLADGSRIALADWTTDDVYATITSKPLAKPIRAFTNGVAKRI